MKNIQNIQIFDEDGPGMEIEILYRQHILCFVRICCWMAGLRSRKCSLGLQI